MEPAATYLSREALAAVQADRLPGRARRWIERRIKAHGYDSIAHNLGGLRCCHAHRHGSDGRCVVVGGRPLARFPTVLVGAGELVRAAVRASAEPHAPAPDLVVGGFRSVHPNPDEIGATSDDLPYLGFLFPPTAALAAAYAAYRAATGPSGEAERRFRELSADWEAFERAGVTGPRFAHLAPDLQSWRAFRDAWHGGEPDVAALTEQETAANRVRAYLFEASRDPRFAPQGRLRGGDINDTTPARQAAAVVDQAVRTAQQQASRATRDLWTEIPWQAKAGAAAVGVLWVATLVRELVRVVR
ncbi:MAG: hypothetical protein IT372_08070 [Polyangiaceae bacterium]|nr:hypothetical protein [Polyangiaceae bacterium]